MVGSDIPGDMSWPVHFTPLEQRCRELEAALLEISRTSALRIAPPEHLLKQISTIARDVLSR